MNAKGFSPWTWLMLSSIVGSTVFLGAASDFFWHLHGLPEDIFSNPHIILLGGLLVNILWITFLWWRKVNFIGMTISAVGVVLFVLSFGVDIMSHSYWGFEMGVESVYSLSHLGIVVAIILINYGWAKSALAWAEEQADERFKIYLPAAIGYTGAICMVWLILVIILPQHAPFASNVYKPEVMGQLGAVLTGKGYVIPGQPGSEGLIYFDKMFYLLQSTGTMSIFFYSVLLTAVVFRLNKGQKLPFGVITFVLTFASITLSLGNDHFEFIGVGIVTGLFADFIMGFFWESRWKQYVLAAILPGLYFSLYFIIINQDAGIWWGLPQTLGVIGFAACWGFIVAWVVGDLRVEPEYRSRYSRF